MFCRVDVAEIAPLFSPDAFFSSGSEKIDAALFPQHRAIPYGTIVEVAGSPGTGKSTLVQDMVFRFLSSHFAPSSSSERRRRAPVVLWMTTASASESIPLAQFVEQLTQDLGLEASSFKGRSSSQQQSQGSLSQPSSSWLEDHATPSSKQLDEPCAEFHDGSIGQRTVLSMLEESFFVVEVDQMSQVLDVLHSLHEDLAWRRQAATVHKKDNEAPVPVDVLVVLDALVPLLWHPTMQYMAAKEVLSPSPSNSAPDILSKIALATTTESETSDPTIRQPSVKSLQLSSGIGGYTTILQELGCALRRIVSDSGFAKPLNQEEDYSSPLLAKRGRLSDALRRCCRLGNVQSEVAATRVAAVVVNGVSSSSASFQPLTSYGGSVWQAVPDISIRIESDVLSQINNVQSDKRRQKRMRVEDSSAPEGDFFGPMRASLVEGGCVNTESYF